MHGPGFTASRPSAWIAVDAGLDRNTLYMVSLEHDIEASRAPSTSASRCTEIATLRAQLGGAQQGYVPLR